MTIVAEAGRDDDDRVVVLYRRRQHDRAGQAGLAAERGQLNDGHPPGAPSDAAAGDLDHVPMQRVQRLPLPVGRHAAHTIAAVLTVARDGSVADAASGPPPRWAPSAVTTSETARV